MTNPTFSQIKAQVAAIRQKVPQARVIGIRALGRWTGDTQRRDGDQAYLIQQCDSPLAMRLALRQPADPNATKILITSLEEKDLSEDILLRLAKRRLFAVDSWQIVRSLFAAHAVDPRLTKSAWIADMLLDLVPAEGYPAARGGFLDADTAWPLLLRHTIGLAAETPDLTALLKWSLDGEATARFRLSAKAFQLGATQWLAEKAGPVAEAVLGCVARLDRPDAVPLGLAAGVVCHPAAAGKLEKATGKLEERFLGGKSPDASLMQRWSTAATEVVRALRFTDPKTHRQTLQRTDEILSEVQGDGFAYLSDVSPIGFDQRLTRFGQQLGSVLESLEKTEGSGVFCRNGPEGAAHKRLLTPFPDDLDALKEARRSVRDHDQAARETRRLERADMAVRLVRWLKESLVTGQESNDKGQMTNDKGEMTNPRSFADAANAHLRDGGFVDWARLSLRSGDPVQGLSETYARLFDAVTRLREQQAKQFAQLLTDWTAAGSPSDEVIPIERILEQIVAPLAAENPVLVIVIDGMSVAVCRELLSDLTRHEWMAICEPGRNFNRPAVATLPSVTEFSRTSLLCGRLQAGAANNERAGFAEHPALLARCRTGSPPLLFHRATLQENDDGMLAADVRHEIGSAHRKIVGVVVNAVDDHLLKGGQIDTRWSRDEIKVLPALLHEARTARRLVVLLADHGHVLDCQTRYVEKGTGPFCRNGPEGASHKMDLSPFQRDGGERWRVASGTPAADELLVQGQRVLVEGHRLIAPWSERVRYGSMKNGYHGGLSPQEMVVPIAVLSSIDSLPAGWHEQPVDTPAWWDEPASVVAAPQQPAPVLKPKQLPPGALFDMKEVSCQLSVVSCQLEGGELTLPEWVARLLTSPVFEEQKRLGGRGLPADDVFAKLLGTLDRRGGKLTSVALARALEFPALRLSGLLAKAQRVLNIDGYAVLSRDDASDTVELNRELLLKQFDLV